MEIRIDKEDDSNPEKILEEIFGPRKPIGDPSKQTGSGENFKLPALHPSDVKVSLDPMSNAEGLQHSFDGSAFHIPESSTLDQSGMDVLGLDSVRLDHSLEGLSAPSKISLVESSIEFLRGFDPLLEEFRSRLDPESYKHLMIARNLVVRVIENNKQNRLTAKLLRSYVTEVDISKGDSDVGALSLIPSPFTKEQIVTALSNQKSGIGYSTNQPESSKFMGVFKTKDGDIFDVHCELEDPNFLAISDFEGLETGLNSSNIMGFGTPCTIDMKPPSSAPFTDVQLRKATQTPESGLFLSDLSVNLADHELKDLLTHNGKILTLARWRNEVKIIGMAPETEAEKIQKAIFASITPANGLARSCGYTGREIFETHQEATRIKLIGDHRVTLCDVVEAKLLKTKDGKMIMVGYDGETIFIPSGYIHELRNGEIVGL